MKAARILVLVLTISLLPLFVNAGIQVLGKMIYKNTAQKGETYSIVIKVNNRGYDDQEVHIYQTDYLYDYTGNSFYNEPGTHARSNAQWIDYSPKTIILKGNEKQSVLLEVTVPQSDTLVGTFWSLIMVEGITPIDPNAKGQLNIHESIRTAIQIVTNIGNTGTGELEFQNPGIVTEDDKLFFDFVLLNTGQRLISPDVSMELFDAQTGESIKVLKAPRNGMYPTTSTKWRFALDGIPKKTYKAVIVADGAGDDVFGLEYTLEL